MTSEENSSETIALVTPIVYWTFVNKESDKRDARQSADKSSRVRLSVGGQVIQVSWDDLLDPSKWFAQAESSESPSEPG